MAFPSVVGIASTHNIPIGALRGALGQKLKTGSSSSDQKSGKLRGTRGVRVSWTVFLIAFAILGYLISICLSVMLLVKYDPSGFRGSGASWVSRHNIWTSTSRKLAVLVPTHDGDIDLAFLSMKRWPGACSYTTLTQVDLILYHATAVDTAGLRQRLPDEASSCFRNARVVSAKLSPEVSYFRACATMYTA